MGSENEPAKLLLPYLQRADELQKHEPLVAYYCRLFAMEKGLKIPQGERTKTTNALLVSLMNQLEKDKKSLKLGPDDNLYVEGFASSVFAKADKQDRAGRADLNTAKTFYAASLFFEILNQFGAVQPDLEQKQKYAVWKAADIRKALKEGRKPVPGPPGGDEDLSVPSRASSGEHDLELSRSDSATIPDSTKTESSTGIAPDPDSPLPHPYDKPNPLHPTNISQPPNLTHLPSPNISTPTHYPTDNNYPPESYNQPELQHHSPQHYPSQNVPSYFYQNLQSYPSFTENTLPTAPSQYPSYSNLPPPNTANYHPSAQYDSISRNENVQEALPVSPTPKYEYDSSYQPSPEQIAEAHKAARFAVGALAFDDVSVAVDFLKKSLELLTKPSGSR